jgi:O-antigen/teichoic acid export membrane protein
VHPAGSSATVALDSSAVSAHPTAMIVRTLRRLLRPTVWVTVERVFTEVFSLALFAVQARLLGPQAFGLIAAVMVFVTFWDTVPMNVVLEALVSVRMIDKSHFATAATATILVSLIFGAVVFSLAGPVANLFGDQELASVMRAMALLPPLQAFSTVPLAVTRRDLRFEATTVRTIVSLIAGGAVGLVLALRGSGVWALVWQALVQRLVAAIVLWSAVRMPLRPMLSPRHGRDLAVFVGPILWSSVMNWGAGQLPRLFLGIYLGPVDLGLFSTAGRFNAIAKQVAMLPKAFVARVDLRRFATDRAAMAHAARRVFLQIGFLGFPICFGGAAVMPTLFHVWLDPRWYDAILPSQIMLLGCVPFVTFFGSTAVLYALNQQGPEARVSTTLNMVMLAGMAVGMRYGLIAISAAVALAPLLLLPLPTLAVRRTGYVAVRDIVMPQVAPLLAAAGMGGAVCLLRHYLAPYVPEAKALPMLVAVGALLYPAGIVVLMPRQARQIVAKFRG